MMSFLKKNRFGIIYGIILVGFTVYAALDVFVIPHPQATVEVPASAVNTENYSEIDIAEAHPSEVDGLENNSVGSQASEISSIDDSEGDNSDIKDNVDVTDKADIEDGEHLNKDVAPKDKPDANDKSDAKDKPDANDKSDPNDKPDPKDKADSTDNDESADGTALKNESDSNLQSETESEKDSEDSSLTGLVAHIGDYADGSITIAVDQYREYDTDIYVADVTLADASLLKTAFADDMFGRNIKARTSEIAAAHGAILAINGDFYGARETGYVIRNGVLYRNEANPGAQDLVVYGDGSFQLSSENQTTAEDLLNAGAIQVISFGPGLLSGGKIIVSSDTEVAVASPSNPRSAIGKSSGLHYVFVCSDGRTAESAGLTLLQLAEFMKSLGVKTAYNLDGGGSSAIYFQGALLNKPTTDGKKIVERTVSDILYIGY